MGVAYLRQDIPFCYFFNYGRNDKTNQGAKGINSCESNITMRIQINSQICYPYQSRMEKCGKWIKQSCNDQMIFTMYPFAYLMIHFIHFMKNYHRLRYLSLISFINLIKLNPINQIIFFIVSLQLKMGTKQSTPSRPVSKLESSQMQQTLDHPHFHKAKLYNDKNGQYIQIQVPIVNDIEILNWQKLFKPFVQYECLLLPLSFELKKTQLCGSSGISKIKYENYPYILKKQIEDRAKQPRKLFENHQLWYLAFNLLESTQVFHAKNQKVGDIRPLNVFINDDGQIKVANQYSWPHEYTNIQKFLHEKQITYLSPQQIKNIFFGSQKTEDIQLTESFSVGLTLLDSVILTNSQDLYDINLNRLDYQGLQKRKMDLKSHNQIDNKIIMLILSLTNTNIAQRLRCSDAFNWLNLYRQPIINMEPFQCRQVPSWMKNIGNGLNTMARDVPFLPQNRFSPSIPLKASNQQKQQFRQLHFDKPVEQRLVYNNPQIIHNQQIIKNPQFIIPMNQSLPLPRGSSPIKIGIDQNQVYQSSYISVPQKNVSNLRSDDFKSTLTRIEQQLQASRRLYPN